MNECEGVECGRVEEGTIIVRMVIGGKDAILDQSMTMIFFR